MKAMNTLYKGLSPGYLSVCIAVLAAFFVSGCMSQPYGKLGPLCGQRDRMVSVLVNDYGESLASYGPDIRGLVIERWEGETGSWTLLETRSDGISCVLTSGGQWLQA